MAEGGDGADELSWHYGFLGGSVGFVSSAWSQDSDYFPDFSGGNNVPLGYYSACPAAEAPADLFELADPDTGYRNDDVEESAGSWDDCFWTTPSSSQVSNELEGSLVPAQRNEALLIHQPLDTRFAPQITPHLAQQTLQRVFKQEHSPSPTQYSAQHVYGYTTHHGISAPQHGQPQSLGSFPSAAIAQVPVQLAAPPSPTSPVRRKRPSSPSFSSVSVSSSTSPRTVDDNNSTASGLSSGGGGVSRPKKRVIKQQPNRSKAPMTPLQEALHKLINVEGTGVFHRHIPSADAGRANHAELMRMYAKEPAACTDPSTDDTFPTCDAQKLIYVHDMFDAVWDWSDYGEMGKTLGAASMAMWHEAMALPEGDPRRSHLLEQVPSRAEQQQKVLSRVPSDYVVEEICWRLLEYAEKAQQGIAIVKYWSGADGA